MHSVAEAIWQIRKRRGLTQAEFARLIGARQNTISQYESGKLQPSRSMLILLLQLAEGMERTPILDALGIADELRTGWKPGQLEAALGEFEAYLATVGPMHHGDAEGALAAFAREAAAIVAERQSMDPALVEILRLWRKHASDPAAREFFTHLPIYLNVRLGPLEARGADVARQNPHKKKHGRS